MMSQAEALRGDQEGFAHQQQVLDTAQKLVERAQAQVAAMEANTPSLEQVHKLDSFLDKCVKCVHLGFIVCQ